MKKYKFLILSCLVLNLFSGCGFNNTTDVNTPNDNDGFDIDVPVSFNVEPHSDVTSVSGNIENNNSEDNISFESGEVNINQGTINNNNNINVYVDKVLTDLVDINGNVVMPFTDNTEIYVPLSSLGEILDKPVEWDRTNKSVYVGDSPNRSTNMLDIIHGYDPQNIKEYSFLENKGTEYFTMAGKKYTDGLVAETYLSSLASINFNLEGKYEHLSFNFGHLDGTEMNPINLVIKLDSFVEKQIEINAEDYPVSIEIDVNNALQLRFELYLNYCTGYAFTDMTLT